MKERHCGSKWGGDVRGFPEWDPVEASPEGVMRSSVWRQAVDKAQDRAETAKAWPVRAAHHEH